MASAADTTSGAQGSSAVLVGADATADALAAFAAAGARETRSNAKIIPYVPPRIDWESFQAEVPGLRPRPALQKEERAPAVELYGATRRIHVREENTSKVQEFIAFARNLSHNVVADDEGRRWDAFSANLPLESDELVLKYLSQHNYDVALAKFHLMCELGVGKDVVYATANMEKRSYDQSPAVAWNALAKPYFGNYLTSEEIGRNYVSAICMTRTDGSAEGASAEPDHPDSEEAPGAIHDKDTLRRPRGVGKQILRKRWTALRERISTVLDAVHGASKDKRAPMEDVLSVLQEAAEIEPLVENPGETFMSSIFADLLELFQVLNPAKLWIAQLHDMFNSPDVFKGTDVTKLKNHLHEAEALSVRCPEEALAKTLLRRFAEWTTQAKAIVEQSQAFMNTMSSKNNGSTATSEVSSAEDDRADLETVSQILIEAECFPVTLSQHQELEGLYMAALAEHFNLEEFMDRVDMSRNRRPGKSSKITEEMAVGILKQMDSSPLRIRRAVELQAVIQECQSWHSAVMEALQAEAMISLKKVESFINDGERLPFQYNTELAQLRERRSLAKAWLDKLKKSFLKTSRSTRKTGGDSEKLSLDQMRDMVQEGSVLYDNSNQNKDLRKASEVVEAADDWLTRVRDLMSGENADADYLQDLIGEAETMPIAMDEVELLRVHIKAMQWTKTAAPVLSNPNSKYSEIQKIYKEIQKIRCIDIGEDESGTPQSASVEDMWYDGGGLKFPKFPEEIQLEKIVSDVDAWMKSIKDIYHAGAVKKGVTLDQLRAVYESRKEIPVDLTFEARHLRSAISAAEDWIDTYKTYLKALGIDVVNQRTIDSGDSQHLKNESEDDESTIDGSSMDVDLDSRKLAFKKFSHMYNAAASISVEFHELSALRDRFSDVNKWLTAIRTVCPKRSIKRRSGFNIGLEKMIVCGQKSFYSEETDLSSAKCIDDLVDLSWVVPGHVTAPYMKALTTFGDKFFVDIGDEATRAEEMFQLGEDWDVRAAEVHTGLRSKLSEIFSSFVDLAVKGSTGFPSMRSLESTPTIAIDETDAPPTQVDESSTYAKFLNIMKDLGDFISEGESIGIYTPQRVNSYAFLLINEWISAAHQYLHVSYHWGDMDRKIPQKLIHEARQIIDSTESANLDSFYASTNLIKRSAVPQAEAATPAVDAESKESAMEIAEDTQIADEQYAADKDVVEDDIGQRRRKRRLFDDEIIESEVGAAGAPSGDSKRKARSSLAAATPSIQDSKRKGAKLETPAVAEELSGQAEEEINPSKEISNATASIVSLKCMQSLPKDIIPDELRQIVDFYIRCLSALIDRINDVAEWSDRVAEAQKQMIRNKERNKSRRDSNKTGGTEASEEDDFKTFSDLLAEAKSKGFQSAKFDTLSQQIESVSNWIQLSKAIIADETKLGIEALQAHIKVGEKLPFPNQALLGPLKAYCREAYAWISKYEEYCGEDDGKGGVVKQQLNALIELLPSSSTIKGVDLSEYLGYIERMTQVYCMCRLSTHGSMIGCDVCSDWFHAPCLGVSAAQMEKIEASKESFVCPRCAIVESMTVSVVQAAEIVNSWMDPKEAAKMLQSKLLKISKRQTKLEKDISNAIASRDAFKGQLYLVKSALLTAIIRDNGAQPAATLAVPAPPSSEEGGTILEAQQDGSSATPPAAVSVDAASAPMLTETPAHSAKVSMYANDPKDLLMQEISMFEHKIPELENHIAFYRTQLEIVEAERKHLIEISQGLSPEQKDRLIEWMLKAQIYLWPSTDEQRLMGIPAVDAPAAGLAELAASAATLGVSQHDDVVAVMHALEWADWFHRSLLLMRRPPTARALRRHLSAPVLQANPADRTVKSMHSLLNRALAWKTKVRKVLFSGGAKGRKPAAATAAGAPAKAPKNAPLDLNALNDLILEGMSVPVLSRVSSYLNKMLEDANISSKDAASKPNKKQKVAAGSAGQVADSLAAGGAAKVLTPLPGYPESDDETDYNDVATTSCPFHYRCIPDFQMATIPVVWPSKSIGLLRPLVLVSASSSAPSASSAHNGRTPGAVVSSATAAARSAAGIEGEEITAEEDASVDTPMETDGDATEDRADL